MDKILSIIDFDGMLYHSIRDTLEESIEALKNKLQNCLDKTNCTHWAGFVGKGKTFRNNISPDYKANRTGKPPKYLSALKEWAIAEYNLNVCIGYEADDICSFWYNIPIYTTSVGLGEDLIIEDELINNRVKRILCSPDKDLLQGIEGKHFNYTYKTTDTAKESFKANPEYTFTKEDNIKGWWVETTEDAVDSFQRMQVVVGDNADAISGIRKKGIKFWEKISAEIKPSWGEILQLYCTEYGLTQGVFEFQKNFRLLHILQTPEDFIREVGKVPDYPNITEVVKEEVVEIKDTF